MCKPLDKLTALIHSTKESVDHTLPLWLYNSSGTDELTAFRILVQETMRELSKTSLAGLKPLALRHLTKLVRKLSELDLLFDDEDASDRKVWAAFPEREKQKFYFCATELCKFVRVMRSGGYWRGVDEKMQDGHIRRNGELEKSQEVYLYFAMEAEEIKLADIDG